MDIGPIIGIAATLLMLGGIAMTQLEGGVGMWLFISWVAIPGFVLVVGLLVNTPSLLFGALIAIGIYAFRH
ncbi:hypothetical protein RSO41_13275 [Halomonas sp. I1]|uniref:hypothetical protein n=1 Tax=Halomonas sp. I1 TaxID=393536 RepID=UPI0028DF69BA|nr:hypothetical protein [Halomonas sp. I1]MDT8895623.1 hypothetical protein [Halomonas sp. I1]